MYLSERQIPLGICYFLFQEKYLIDIYKFNIYDIINENSIIGEEYGKLC